MRPRQNPGRNARTFPSAAVELLEQRRLLAGITLTPMNFNDSAAPGVDSLRNAVITANATPGTDPVTILLQSGTYVLSIPDGAATGQENASQTGDLDIINSAHTLVIQGQGSSGPGATIIEQTVHDRVFHVLPTVHVEFRDLVITGGTAVENGVTGQLPFSTDAYGGGIYNQNGAILLNNVTVSGNQVGVEGNTMLAGFAPQNVYGGGIAINGNNATATITSSVIEENLAIAGQGSSGAAGASGEGGGIYASGFTNQVNVDSSVIASNTAIGGRSNNMFGGSGGQGRGGGISSAAVFNSTNNLISGNLARGGDGPSGGLGTGGGVYGSLTLTDSSLTENQATGGISLLAGSIVFNSGGSASGGGGTGALTLNRVTVSQNQAVGQNGQIGGNANGGGLAAGVLGSLSIVNSTIVNNHASAGNGSADAAGNALGGGVEGSVSQMVNSTVTLNTAQSGAGVDAARAGSARGGGVNVSGSQFRNTLIAGNSVSGPLVIKVQGPDFIGSSLFTERNLIGIYDGTLASGFSGANGDLLGSIATPINPLLGPLANNGGPTQTVALLPGSPAINAGSNTAANALATDQRGPGFPRILGGTVDIGAFEAGSVTTVVSRRIFYNNSKFDGSPAANAADDAAIATDKSPYFAGGGIATAANATSYSRGINGIMIDVAGLNGPISASDFTFKIGSNNSPAAWASAPAPASVLVRSGAGDAGSDRIELVWADGAITNTWLQVTFEGNDAAGGFNTNTNLPTSDVFYFGNRVGDQLIASPPTVFTTNAADEIAARTNIGFNQPVTSDLDFNRDQLINANDQILARANIGFLTRISIPAPAAPAAAAEASDDPRVDYRSVVAFAVAAAHPRLQAAVMDSLTILPVADAGAAGFGFPASVPLEPVLVQPDRPLATDSPEPWAIAPELLDELIAEIGPV